MNGFMNITDWNANMAESTWAKNANALMDKMLTGVTNGQTEIYCQDEAAAKRLLDFVM